MNTRSFLPALLALLTAALTAEAQNFTPTLVDPGNSNVGQYTSMAIVGGNPAISCYDVATQDLKFVRNSAADGSGTWTATTVDSTGNVGQYTSLVVLANGNPAISYYDVTNTALKFAVNSQPDGSGTWTATIVDTGAIAANIVGQYTSMAIVNGNPAISYYDSTNGDLKYARNSAADGSGTWAIVSVDGTGIAPASSNSVGQYTSLAVIGGNPAIAYNDATATDLKYVRATDADGTAWGAPVFAEVSANSVGTSTSLISLNGGPAISYYTSSAGDLKFARNSAADGSGAWTVTTVDSAGFVGLFTSLAIVGGNPAISYSDSTNTALKFARNSATDGSGTWTLSTVESAGFVGQYASLAIVGGNPAISYYDATTGDLRFARNSTTTGSGTWTAVIIEAAGLPGTAGEYTSHAIVGGNPAISYYDAATNDLKFARNSAADGSGAWSIATVDAVESGFTGQHTSLAVLANGRPAIAYFYGAFADLLFARNSATDGSGTWTITAVDSGGVLGTYTSLAIVGGNPAISYYDTTNTALKFARNAAADGSGVWTTSTVDTGAIAADVVGEHTSMAVLANGNPAISYYDNTNDDLKFARNSAADGSGTWTITSVDGTGIAPASGNNVGQYTSLAIVNGNPAIAYYDVTASALKYARNAAADGRGVWTIVTVNDTGGTVGLYASLKVVDGRPAISYYDASAGDLKYASATNANGTAWSPAQTVEGTGNVGQYTSLAVLANGRPAVSYYDATNGDLRWAIEVAPEIAVEQPAGTDLVDGSASVAFAPTLVGTNSAIKTFTIKNTGVSTLTLTAPATTGGNAGDFVVNTTGTLLSIPTGQETTFTVTFTPTASGNRTTTLSIANNDTNEGPFEITLTGTGAVPEIAIEQPASTLVADGGAKGFGNIALGSPASLVFTVRNTAAVDLLDPSNGSNSFTITIDGTDAADFTVTATPTAPVAGGGSTTFTVQFAPTTAGAKTAALHLANNDPDENPYDITLSGAAFSFTADTDGDGMNDASEVQLTALGFNPTLNQAALVNTLLGNLGGLQPNLNTAGYYTAAQVQALHVGTPLLEKSGGTFKLTLRLKKSPTLSPPNFLPFAFTEVGTVINGQGEIEYEFTVPGDAAFFRLEAE